MMRSRLDPAKREDYAARVGLVRAWLDRHRAALEARKRLCVTPLPGRLLDV
jgi:hypothetical protein